MFKDKLNNHSTGCFRCIFEVICSPHILTSYEKGRNNFWYPCFGPSHYSTTVTTLSSCVCSLILNSDIFQEHFLKIMFRFIIMLYRTKWKLSNYFSNPLWKFKHVLYSDFLVEIYKLTAFFQGQLLYTFHESSSQTFRHKNDKHFIFTFWWFLITFWEI